jgi:hypothetical protein
MVKRKGKRKGNKEINHRWHYWVKPHKRNGKTIKGHYRVYPWEI